MTTIEQRARQYANKMNGGEYEGALWQACYERYIEIATEQKQIDLCLIAKWFKKNWRNYIDTDADGMIRFAGWEKDLKEAMEG